MDLGVPLITATIGNPEDSCLQGYWQNRNWRDGFEPNALGAARGYLLVNMTQALENWHLRLVGLAQALQYLDIQ